MVLMVDRPIDELIVVCCAQKSTVLVHTLTKKSNLAQLNFFNRSLSDLFLERDLRFPKLYSL
jgi:hypothetical protein